MRASFSSDAKDALARNVPDAAHCRDALAFGLAFYGSKGDRFRTSRLSVARLFRSLAGGSVRSHGTHYDVSPSARPIERALPANRCDRRMELRAAFLAAGSISIARGGYHLEFDLDDDGAQRAERLLAALDLPPKRAVRRSHVVLYFKEFDRIAALLSSMEAYAALLAMENRRALRDTKNRIHRLVNSEAANVERAVGAGAQQRLAFSFLADAYGLANLSPRLREVAQLRLRYPDETLRELGERCVPAAGKSTVNGRVTQLMRLAERLKGSARK